MVGRSGFSGGALRLANSSVQVLKPAACAALSMSALGVVARVELLEIVRRQEHREGAVGAVLVGDRRQEQRGRCGIGEAHRVVVDLLDLGRRAVGILDPAGQGGRQLLVEEHIVVPEQDVVGAERLAVGPLGPLAQLDGPGLEVG